MNLKEKLEHSIVWIVISIAVAAFSAGMGIMHTIYQAREKGDKPTSVIDKSKIKEEENIPINPAEYGEVFKPGEPYPIGFEQIKIGTRFSILKSLYPNGELNFGSQYRFSVNHGPFDIIYYYINYDERINDGIIYNLAFNFRGSSVREYIIKCALAAFGSEKLITKYQGEILEWKNIKGVEVRIDKDEYRIYKIQKLPW